MVEQWNLEGAKLDRIKDLDMALSTSDITILLQDHTSYDHKSLADKAKLLFDTRGQIDIAGVERL
jgi:UDP-N-acetyl-D-mannosaminuronate dehydrogenase